MYACVLSILKLQNVKKKIKKRAMTLQLDISLYKTPDLLTFSLFLSQTISTQG